jgi:hypothetical protein
MGLVVFLGQDFDQVRNGRGHLTHTEFYGNWKIVKFRRQCSKKIGNLKSDIMA